MDKIFRRPPLIALQDDQTLLLSFFFFFPNVPVIGSPSGPYAPRVYMKRVPPKTGTRGYYYEVNNKKHKLNG